MGIELKATLEAHKLLIPLNEKNAKKTGFAQVRYTAGTRFFEAEFCRFLHRYLNGKPDVHADSRSL